MSNMTAAKAREAFAEVLNTVAYGKERIVVTRRGKRMAAIMPIEDFEFVEKLEDEIDVRQAKEALQDVKKHGSIPWEKVKERLGL